LVFFWDNRAVILLPHRDRGEDEERRGEARASFAHVRVQYSWQNITDNQVHV